MSKRVLVVGAAGGIGFAAATELAERGHDVIAADLRSDELGALPVAVRLPLDVTDPASVDAAVRAAEPFDALINTVGLSFWGPIETTPFSDVRRVFEVNLFGAIRLNQAVVPILRERGGGTIVHLSSSGARMINPATGYYGATKSALEAVCEALRMETRHLGIRVVVVQPGAVATNMAERRFAAETTDTAYQSLMNTLKDMVDDSEKLPAEAVGAMLADIIEQDDPAFRWPVPESVALATAARNAMTDEAYEAITRKRFLLPDS